MITNSPATVNWALFVSCFAAGVAVATMFWAWIAHKWAEKARKKEVQRRSKRK